MNEWMNDYKEIKGYKKSMSSEHYKQISEWMWGNKLTCYHWC